MLTREDDVDAHALRRQGWTISAIARHLGHDRKTIRAYLGEPCRRGPGERRAEPARALPGYLRQLLTDDPHVWASALFDETVALRYDRSYSWCSTCAGACGSKLNLPDGVEPKGAVPNDQRHDSSSRAAITPVAWPTSIRVGPPPSFRISQLLAARSITGSRARRTCAWPARTTRGSGPGPRRRGSG